MPYGRYTGRKRKRPFKKGYDRQIGFYGRNLKRRKYSKYSRFSDRGSSGVEKKFYDVSVDDASIGTGFGSLTMTSAGASTTTQTIVDIPQNTSESGRIGRKCTITKIMCRFNVQFAPVERTDLEMADNAHETVRIVLYWDKQCNGAFAIGTDLFEVNEYNAYC